MTNTPLSKALGRTLLTVAASATIVVAAATATSPALAEASTYRSPACLNSNLTGKLVEDGGGAAGSDQVAIQLTNTGSHSCTLRGFPGVSLVGHHNGTQIGAAADRYRGSIDPTITLAPKHSAIAPLRISQALNYPVSACKPVATDGFRVYPPDERYSLFVKATGITGCADARSHILTISPFRPAR